MSQDSSPVTPTHAPSTPRIMETKVSIERKSGTCQASLCSPETGKYPGVLIWPDALGLRDSMREMARRLAGEGYAVLVPDLFYRISPKPPLDPAKFNFSDPADRAKIQPLMASVTASGHAEEDADAYVTFLDAQQAVDKGRRIGTQGYCLGGPLGYALLQYDRTAWGPPLLFTVAAWSQVSWEVRN